ncbi:hypothetical protein [Pseudoalteromonas sp.]|uniref:hypothetical protein n=1 Tax=Pseudoalteromonas sp. TaxID=53249 RepID=UPI003568036F
MNKTLTFSFLVCLLLTACSKQEPSYTSYSEAQQALQAVNLALYPPPQLKHKGLLDEQLPFTDDYLTQRHYIYQQLMQMTLTEPQTAQVNYLVIAERFPERYFAWPAHTNVLTNLINLATSAADYQKVAQWLKFVQQQLVNAEQSNLKLNKIERNRLASYVTAAINDSDTPDQLLAQLQTFNEYLISYIPRGSVGLYGLANGSAWYQSKVNYFSGQVHSPLQWLTIINQQLKNAQPQANEDVVMVNQQQSFILQFSNHAQRAAGLDWLTGYTDLPHMANRIELTDYQTSLMLAMMETDVGIHIHAWTLPQARINLIKRLQVSPETADQLVTNIVLFPAHAFSFYANAVNQDKI